MAQESKPSSPTFPVWGKLFFITALLVILSLAPSPKRCVLLRQARVGKRDYGILGNILASYWTSQHSQPDPGVLKMERQTCKATASSPSRLSSLRSYDKSQDSGKVKEKRRRRTTLEFLQTILSLCIPQALPERLPDYAAHRLSETDSMRMPKQTVAAVPGAPWL
eukprot:gnl/MRDRNA2_/MRDRNA2_92233_c0_seq1.p1 gnl/MRDRNA2_/MRDRNA2_92233_c0~~gnl/MRDRNA2_/MRDRNA2_92233_c0_seq1.p1  ORF type:complete len:165 (+),score=26.28 gnl/MRDRNA2_/MRDRNA2_92233_c0_seq1:158-652(+)